MSAKSVCQAFCVFFVVTVVSGQYLFQTTFKDSLCLVADGGIVITNMGVDCIPSTCTNTGLGLYKTEVCVDAPPPVADNATFSFYSNGCDGEFNLRFSAPLELCTAGGTSILKFSGCNAQNSSFIFTTYETLDDYTNDINGFVSVYVSDQCTTVQGQVQAVCPPALPMSPPVDAPIAEPIASPVSAAPVTSTPTSTQAATPAKKTSNAAYNNVLGITSVVAALLACV